MTTYISRAEADELCDGLIKQYIGSKEVTPAFVDIDGFVKDFLNLENESGIAAVDGKAEFQEVYGIDARGRQTSGNGIRAACVRKCFRTHVYSIADPYSARKFRIQSFHSCLVHHACHLHHLFLHGNGD